MIISADRFQNVIKREPAFDWLFWKIDRHTFSDEYYIPRLSDLATFLGDFLRLITDFELEYERGSFDCNAYAYNFRGYVEFQAWKDQTMRAPWTVALVLANSNVSQTFENGHAFNVAYVRSNDKLMWVQVEPQTGDIRPLTSSPWLDIYTILF